MPGPLNQLLDSTYSDPASATTQATPPISLSATGYKDKRVQHVDHSWTDATDAVDIYRDGKILEEGFGQSDCTDNIGVKGGGASYVYHVCKTGTLNCSYDVTVNF